MKSVNVRRFISVSLVLILVTSASIGNMAPVLAAGNSGNGTGKNVPQVVGLISITGTVTINDKQVSSGTSVFDNSIIKVACSSSAIVNLGRLGRVELNPGAHLVLRFSAGLIGGNLLEGNILVNSPAGVKVSISTPDGVTAADGNAPSVIPVRSQKGVRCVPMVAAGGASSPAIGTGTIAALLIGLGGAAVAGAAVGVNTDKAASGVVP